jgi:hypothetical protein
VPIAEACYQRGTPQDTNAWNSVPKRDFKGQDKGTRICLCNGTTLCQGPCGRVRSAGWSVLLLSAERRIGNLSGKMIRASLDDKGPNVPFPSRELFPLGGLPKDRALFDVRIAASLCAKLG